MEIVVKMTNNLLFQIFEIGKMYIKTILKRELSENGLN